MTIEELYTAIGGSYENAKKTMMMDKMISRFVVKLLDDTSCQKLMEGFAAGDGAAIFEGAHAMKGVCANLGLTSLSEKAGEITEEFRPGNARKLSDGELKEKVAALREQYDRTIEGIHKFAEEQ